MDLSPEVKAALKIRRAELVTKRDAFIVQANQEIAVFNGAIAELDHLTEEPKPVESPNGVGEPAAAK